MKALLLMLIISLAILSSCKKDKAYVNSTDRYLGHYCGDIEYNGVGVQHISQLQKALPIILKLYSIL